MSALAMAWRQVAARALQNGLTALVAGVAVALALSTALLAQGLQRGIDRASGPYDLLIGGKGNAQQLVLNTVLLQGAPLENVPFDVYERLQADPGVAAAVPLSYGDNYKRLKIVGTKSLFFSFRNKPADPPYFTVARGRVFEQPFEAVLGAEAARRTGLAPGATFRAEHGDEEDLPGEEDEDHVGHPYTVVGVLAPTHSPADLGIYVDIESYWVIHAGQPHLLGDPTGPRAVTAVLVKPRLFPQDIYRVQQAVNSGRMGRDAQAVIPYNELYKLNQQIGQGQRVLAALGYVAVGLATVTTFLALYGAIVERRRDIAVMRALGAPRSRVFLLVLIESGLVALAGLAFGTALGHAGAWAIGQIIRDASNIQIVLGVASAEPLLLAGVLALGLLAGLAPALSAARTEPARYLAPI